MSKDGTMLDAVVNLFSRRNPRRDAVLGLARIISRYDLVNLGYSEGHREDRRSRDEHHASWGVWLFPCREDDRAEGLKISSGVPAVTHDLRSEGLGIMTPLRLQGDYFFVAVPDEEDDTWKFFKGQVRHYTRRPGGWHHLGLQVLRTIVLESQQRAEFRQHIQSIESGAVE